MDRSRYRADMKDTAIPFCSGYQSFIAVKHSSRTVVGYSPIVDAKPEDMSTVYTVMEKCTEISHALGRSFSVQTMDQQLYCIAKQVMWHLPVEFNNHTLRLGSFHTQCCFISSIGQLWGDVGLREILIDSGVYASVTVDQILSGKQYKRAVRGLISIDVRSTNEVLHDVFFQVV